MTRSRTAQLLAGISAVAFLLAFLFHAWQYRAVVLRVQQDVSGLAPLVAALWLAFAVAMLVVGGMVTLVALGWVSGGRWILALAGCLPLLTIILQLRLLGFSRATGVLAVVAAITLAAAVAHPSAGDASAGAR